MNRVAHALAWAVVGLLAGGDSGAMGAEAVAMATSTPGAGPGAATVATPAPVRFPRDHGPHELLTEWWYYSGHLASQDGRRFGFEFVIFRAERDPLGVIWASHLAVTDEAGERFAYDQRSEFGDQVDRSEPEAGFDLAITGDVSPGVRGRGPAWTMTGGLGRDRLDAQGGRSSVGLGAGLMLDLRDDGGPLLHGDDGYVRFGPSEGSYYYSRPRMAATGSVTLGHEVFRVSGSAWFDHQWGNFIRVGDGWDWFAVNLDDGTDLMVSVIRQPDGHDALLYGTLRDDRGSRPLGRGDVVVEPQAVWTSPHTSIPWPAGWHLEVPDEGLRIDLRPTLADQELDTRATTAVVYWEGSQVVTAERDGSPLAGEAYVELTGYGPDPGGH